MLTEAPVPEEIGKKKGAVEVEAKVNVMSFRALCEPIVLLLILIFPFRCEIRPCDVEALELVIAMFLIVLLLMVLNGVPIEVEIRIRRGVGVPVAPPV